MENPMLPHTHTWMVYSTDVWAHTLTVYCPCGRVGTAEHVSPDDLQAALKVSPEQAQWEGPVLECE